MENIRGDWVGWVFPVPGRSVLAAETIGANASWFEAILTPQGPVRVEQAFVFDREIFPPGADPVLEVGVRLRFAEGWVALGLHRVTLLGRDDTPPTDLRFAWGGQVLETHIAGIIGGLAVTDPDTPQGAHTYRLAWPDEAWFEVVDSNVLKLRQGVDLLRSGGTVREVIVLADDGQHEVAMTLAFEVVNVTNLDDLPAPVPLQALPMVPISGVFWGRGELRPAVLVGPVEPPAEGALPLASVAGGTAHHHAAVTRHGLLLLDTDGDRRFAPGDHMLDATRAAWTVPPDELRGQDEALLTTPASGSFALRLIDRGRPPLEAPAPDPGGASSADWFA